MRLVWLTLLSILIPAAPGSALLVGDDDEPREVDLMMLTSIDYEQGRPLPDEILELDGERVLVRGYMGPYTQEGAHDFRLITDSCGCDGPPKVHHFVHVDLGTEVTGSTPV